MNSKHNENLYDYLLYKTKGNLNKHSVKYELRKLEPTTKIYTLVNQISGCLVNSVAPEETDNNQILIAGDPQHFQNEKIYLDKTNLLPLEDEVITFTNFTDEKNNHYYCSDEAGMFLETFSITLKHLVIESIKTLTQKRIAKVEDFFIRHQDRLGRPLTNQEIYEHIGSPTKQALWCEWQRLYPEIFTTKFQKNFFDEQDLPKITYKSGNDPERNKVVPKHQL